MPRLPTSLAIMTSLLVVGAGPEASAKDQWVVNTVVDDPDSSECNGVPGDCSLRGAILAINQGEGDGERENTGGHLLTDAKGCIVGICSTQQHIYV